MTTVSSFLQAVAILSGSLLAGQAGASVASTPPPPQARVSFEDTAVADGRADLAHVEPHLAVDPDDPRRLMVGTIVRSPERDGAWHCAVLVSTDGGDRWRRRDFETMDRCIDPWVLFTPDGAALFTAIEISDDVPHPGRFALLAWRSEDDGETWSGPATLGRSHEHQILAADRDDGRIWAVSRRMYAGPDGGEKHGLGLMESTDDGRSFVDVSVQRPVALGMTAAGLVVGPDGRIRVGFRDYLRDDEEGVPPLRTPRAWLLRSNDGGRTFGPPEFVTEACGHADAFPGYPSLAGVGDRLVLACIRDDLDGLAVVSSDDDGISWRGPVTVAAGGPEEPAHVRTPMLAMAADGTVGLAWYDRRHDPERECQDVYFVVSTDGGASFGEPVRVTSETSCPGVAGNGSVARSWPMGGDYGAMAATPSGDFHLVWADSRSGIFQLRQALLTVPR